MCINSSKRLFKTYQFFSDLFSAFSYEAITASAIIVDVSISSLSTHRAPLQCLQPFLDRRVGRRKSHRSCFPARGREDMFPRQRRRA